MVIFLAIIYLSIFYVGCKGGGNYELTLKDTITSIHLSSNECLLICNQISETWRSAIQSSYGDFNQDIAKAKKGFEDAGLYKKLDIQKSGIELNMKKLQNPSKKYQQTYDLLLEMFGYYTQLYSQSASPSGSLMTYNSDVSSKSSELEKVYNKILVVMPGLK